MAAITRAQPICLKLSGTAFLSPWINRRVIDFSAHRISVFARARPFDAQRHLSKTRVINFAGVASRGVRITRPTVERLTPIFRASSFCVAFGFAATSLAIVAYSSASRRGRPMVSRLALNAIALRSAICHTVA